jgi:hypothetical protein
VTRCNCLAPEHALKVIKRLNPDGCRADVHLARTFLNRVRSFDRIYSTAGIPVPPTCSA